jgi:hypothetical protein
MRNIEQHASETVNKVLVGRGLHSSTLQLNVSAYYGIGGQLRGYSGGVYVVCQGVCGGVLCQKRLRLD